MLAASGPIPLDSYLCYHFDSRGGHPGSLGLPHLYAPPPCGTFEPNHADHAVKYVRQLSETQWTRVLALVGILIALANMVFAWLIMLTGSSATFGDITGLANTSATQLEGLAQLAERVYTYDETRLVMGFAFALLSMGFSLFVMGIESAIAVKGEHKDIGNIALKTTSPGVICFILAAILVSFIVLRGTPVFP